MQDVILTIQAGWESWLLEEGIDEPTLQDWHRFKALVDGALIICEEKVPTG